LLFELRFFVWWYCLNPSSFNSLSNSRFGSRLGFAGGEGGLHELAYFGFDSIEGQSETVTMVVCDFLFRVLIGEWEKRVYLLKGLGDDKLKHDLYELVVAIP
jgi:hypothetical protein